MVLVDQSQHVPQRATGQYHTLFTVIEEQTLWILNALNRPFNCAAARERHRLLLWLYWLLLWLWLQPKQFSNLLCRVVAKVVSAPLDQRLASYGSAPYGAKFVSLNAPQNVTTP
jgi:hypothetical protein